MEFFDAAEDLEDGAVACGKFYHGNCWKNCGRIIILHSFFLRRYRIKSKENKTQDHHFFLFNMGQKQ